MPIRARILIVDDEVGSSRLLKANLELSQWWMSFPGHHAKKGRPTSRTRHPWGYYAGRQTVSLGW